MSSFDRRSLATLDALHAAELNFDLDKRGEFTEDNGWRIDEYCLPLPPEPPGPPVSGGSWEVARRLVRDYEFADPKIIRAIYHRDEPLADRTMLLVGRFYGLRFRLGVRVGGVNDNTRTIDGRDVRVWGYNYRTLQGHLEMGQIDYEVWKWLDSGETEFRMEAFSRAAAIPNPIVRLGFRMFGRTMQRRFARRALERMDRLVRAELSDEPQPMAAADRIEVTTPQLDSAADGALAKRAGEGETRRRTRADQR